MFTVTIHISGKEITANKSVLQAPCKGAFKGSLADFGQLCTLRSSNDRTMRLLSIIRDRYIALSDVVQPNEDFIGGAVFGHTIFCAALARDRR